MSTRDEILSALTDHHEGLTVKEIAPLCPACESDEQIVARLIAQLRHEGVIQPGNKLRNGASIYVFAPEGAAAEPEPRHTIPYVPPPKTQHLSEAAREIAAMRHREGKPMAPKKPLAERIVEALKQHGRCSLDQLAKHAGTTKNTLSTMMSGIPRVRRVEPGVYEYAKSNGTKDGAPLSVPAPLKAVPGLRLEEGISGAQFAINEQGELGIEKDDAKLRLDATEFARLRVFIERTQQVWGG